ncbi:hypothetical protein [Streptomyces sp. NPDC093707]|uniref:hypothetical protein n=1 Tax=Streptomyces sp. NPDC093707 TaxID=3154984 RepID=UPI00344C315D
MPSKASKARAASLIASAMDVAYGGSSRMTITVHNTTGSKMTAISTGATPTDLKGQSAPVDFAPKDLAALVKYLAALLFTPLPKGAVSVQVPGHATDRPDVWVWSLTSFQPLRPAEAEARFPGVDVPSSSSAYGCITDQKPPTTEYPLTPLTGQTGSELIYLANY